VYDNCLFAKSQSDLIYVLCFRFWEREKDVESLFDVDLSPAATELVIERDPKTGQFLSIKEA
jgi:hypothetical protein